MTEPINVNESIILNDIPVKLEPDVIVQHLRMRNTNDRILVMINDLIDLVGSDAKPKALYKASRLDRINQEILVIDGITLSHNMKKPELQTGTHVFPYVVTCGLEIEAKQIPASDSMRVMKEYCLNVIKTVVVRNAGSFLKKHIQETFKLKEVSHIGPGEIMGSVSQQQKLFAILGNVEKAIGVTLSPHYLMYPEKSNSGLFYANKLTDP